jgi:hypothetical protein
MNRQTGTFIICICMACFFIFIGIPTMPQLLAIEKNMTISSERYEIGPSNEPGPPLITAPEEIAEIRDVFDLDVKWSNVPSAARYHIILARDRLFKYVIFENATIMGTFLRIRNLDYSTYFLKISSIAKDGTEGPFSDIRSFIIVPHPRSDNPVSLR